MSKFIVIMGTLDTKSDCINFVKAEISKRGHTPIVIDLSMGAKIGERGDVTPEEIARAGGMEIEEVRLSSEREKITSVMTSGATKKAEELYVSGKLHGIIALGGVTAAVMCSRVMQNLPFGVPKLLVSSGASLRGMSSRFIGSKDIVLMHSVVDFIGFNKLLEDVLIRAAGSICGMVTAAGGITPSSVAKEGKQLVAMSVMGAVDKCAHYVTEELNSMGYEVVSFSAAGPGDRAMEDLITNGFFEFVIDLCPGAVGEEILGGTRAAGSKRLEAAGEKGIPEILAPCVVNIMTPPKSKYKPEYNERKRLNIDNLRTWIRLSPEEMRTVARVFAEKLNRAKGKVKFLIPLRGWSSLDREGNPIYAPEIDKIFTRELRKHLNPNVEVEEVDANIDDLKFGKAVVSNFQELAIKGDRKGEKAYA